MPEQAGEPGGKVLRPGECRGHLRRELASSFPEIVQGFVEQAKSGSVQHLKLTTELLDKLDAPKKRKNSAQRLLETLRDRDEKKAYRGDEDQPVEEGWRD